MSTTPRKRQFESEARVPRVKALRPALTPYEDAYHWILTRTWGRFFATIALAFVLVNLLFAGVFALEGNPIHNATTFEDLFYFSIQTLGTIGYGVMYPETRAGNVTVSVEAFAGLVFAALVTGLTFARFARPTARILFSEKMVIAPRDAVPHLMFRIANYRSNQVAEATLHVMLLLPERTKEGDVTRRPHPIALVLSSNPMFAHTWTAMHRIDESSPFFGDEAMARLRADNVEIYVTFSGTDETLAQSVNARVRYTLADIVPNARFADILRIDPDGTRTIDFQHFDKIEPLASD